MTQLELRRREGHEALTQARLVNSQRIAGLGDWDHNFVSGELVWSEEIYRILGLSGPRAELTSAEFYERVHPDDLAEVHRQKKAAAAGLRRVDFSHRIVRPDGEVRIVRQIAETVFDQDGIARHESGTMQDITESRQTENALRASEERFKLLSRAVSDVVWDWDGKTKRLWWSEGFERIFGYAPGEVAAGAAAWMRRIHPDDTRRVAAELRSALAGVSDSWQTEYRFACPRGHYATVQTSGFILRDAAGHAVRMLGGTRDLTEQRKIEENYFRAQRMDSIGTLAGGIAHDLNNMLAPILMSIDLLQLAPHQSPETVEILRTISASAQRGADLIRQVLMFGKGLDGQRIPIAWRALVRELNGIMAQTFPRNITITTEAPETITPMVGDPTQLHQVLFNLALNARDAMPDGGTLAITVSELDLPARHPGTTQETPAGPYVLLTIADTGLGMGPEVRERLFEPFFTTKPMGKGTGLGLATVHAIVKSHRGFVTVDSEPGRGFAFRIYLPVDRERLEWPAPSKPFPPIPIGKNECILVVDDEDAIRKITGLALESFGYQVLTASDGAEALAVFAAHESLIDLVLTDVMMPRMDGIAAIRELRRRNPAIKVIAASGLNTVNDARNAAAAGATRFLPKPFAAPTLLSVVREVLDLPNPV